jgi:hypothetical protein
MKQACLFAAALAFMPISAGATALVNGGFETGDFSGWSWLGSPYSSVVPHLDHFNPSGPSSGYDPVEGAYFAAVTAQMYQTETPEGVFQEIDFDGLTRLSGAAALLSNYIEGYDVQGIVRLVDQQGHAFDLFNNTTLGLGDWGETGWITFSVRPKAGHYRLEAFTLDHTLDAQQSADLLLDGFRTDPVPEPGVWAVMILGFGAAGVMLRRRRPVAA